jgi:succinyl-CoA synthetase beta subunit
MIRLSEAQTKGWLRSLGLPVPWGQAAHSATEAEASIAEHPGPVVVKAMIPTGRRGQSGAVLMADHASDRSSAASKLIGLTVNGYLTEAVYIEERVGIAQEYFFAVVLEGPWPRVIASCKGGVEIEDIARSEPDALVHAEIDPLAGLNLWTATEVWLRAGASGPSLPRLADLSCRLYEAFVRADAVTLEINPLALDDQGEAWLVGAMLGIDDAALGRQARWASASEPLSDNPRERAVALANRAGGGGECQYVELEGDIGLLVGGGGAGLYLHDTVLELGGRPANHCVTPPVSADNRKLKAVLSAILDNPKVRGLLVGFNFAQMARTDIRTRTLVELLDEKQIDTRHFPIVIRLFGAGEELSRQMVAGRPNVHYLPRGTTLKQAAQQIVELTEQARAADQRNGTV